MLSSLSGTVIGETRSPGNVTRARTVLSTTQARLAVDGPLFENGGGYLLSARSGIGEAGTLGSTPCIVAAAVDALSEFGVTHIDMMLRPEKLWRIIHGGQS